ncbi:MAG: DNA-deoxyinosine glycosylase [Ruminococcus sp.]|jgi:hypoxanthine-DNA glycosylase
MKKEVQKLQRVIHEFAPVFDERSRVLMLGTMPSPKSRENGFYYGHPRNRFWPVLAEVCGSPCPGTREEKVKFALDHRIAVWDVLAGCDICGADDSSIQNPVPNDIKAILDQADIQAVFTTGTKAYALYQKYCRQKTGMEAFCLPSTSPANCRVSYEDLVKAYSRILEYL